MSLDEAGARNIVKIEDRWPRDRKAPTPADVGYHVDEQLPRQLRVEIYERKVNGRKYVFRKRTACCSATDCCWVRGNFLSSGEPVYNYRCKTFVREMRKGHAKLLEASIGTMGPIFFLSYARGDIELSDYSKTFFAFVADLKHRVSIKLPQFAADDVMFVDSDIQTGEVWTERLSAAISQCRVGVALFSPRYFTRRWCGQEFQVLSQRSTPGSGASGIIPVRWEKFNGEAPKCAARFQADEGQFPVEYARRGMRQLAVLRATEPLAYEDTMELLADRIAAAAMPQRLKPLPPAFDLETTASAWEEASAADPESHKAGSISKTCFVFLSKAGWDWVPYQDRAEKIGALAQKITGDLGLRYEELPCDETLPQKLVDTSNKDVPTVIFGDPKSLGAGSFADSLGKYDGLFLPNCATLIPWQPETKDAIDRDARWAELRHLKKVRNPPPFHEWRSIFSHDDLDKMTRIHIEQIRSQLMKQLVSDPASTAPIARAEDATLQQSAAAQGIDTQMPPHLGPG